MEQSGPKVKAAAKSRPEKTANFKINSNKMIEQRPRSIGFKTFLNWFKKVENLQRHEEEEEQFSDASTEENSSSSSTATVASFAFLPANMYKPYGDAAQPEKFFSPGPYTDSYLRLIVERNRRRSMDKNITLRKKYSLYRSGTLPTHGQNVTPNEVDEAVLTSSLYDTFSLPTPNKIKADEQKDDRKTASLSSRVRTGTHVKGKRRAPPPPISSDFIRSYRKKRKAPPPPLDLSKNDKGDPVPSPAAVAKNKPNQPEKHSLLPENKGKELNMEISPKPWYKRDSKQKTKASPQDNIKKKTKHEFPEVGFFRCSQLFDNIRNMNSDKAESDSKGEKRMSRFLPNISELDREAAEIIKKHKANMNNDESNESFWLTPNNKPSSTKELISKFNALSTSNEQIKNSHVAPNNHITNNNEIKLTSELIIRPNFVTNVPNSPLLKKSNRFTVENHAENELTKTPSSTRVPREGEISQSFKAEIFSALPGLAATSENAENAHKSGLQNVINKSTRQVEEKLSYMEEKQKLKEQLKEMRNSLPKRPKPKVQKDSSQESASSEANGSANAEPKTPIDLKPSMEIKTKNDKVDKVVKDQNDILKITKVEVLQDSKVVKLNETTDLPKITDEKSNKIPLKKIDSEEPLKILNFLENLNKTQTNQPIYSNKVSSSSQTNCLLKKYEPKNDKNGESSNEKITKNALYSNIDEINKSSVSSTPTNKEDAKLEITTVNLQNERLKNIELPKLKLDNIASTSNANSNETKPVNNTSVLLKRLEQAISDGDDTIAAKLAKDLAMLKVNCLVTCSPTVTEEVVLKRIKVYIEDQFSHQGPIPLKILENSTIGDLKAKVEKELNIPIQTQRWIIGKQLAANDDELLSQYNKNDFETPLFLYVIAKKGKLAMPESTTIGIAVVIKKEINNEEKPLENKSEPVSSVLLNDKTVEDIQPKTNNLPSPIINQPQIEAAKPLPIYNPTSSPALKNITKNTWTCTDCTLINSLLSPLCSACGKKLETVEKENKTKDSPNHYKELLNLDDQDLVLNIETFECPICFQICEPTAGVTLRECIHSFCRECLENTVRYSEEAELKCPYRDADYSCDSIIQEREIRALVNKTIFESHLAKSVKFAENKIQNAFHCKTPDCTGWCIFDDNVNEFRCPACKKTNCLTCQIIHEGKNCKQYQEQINNVGNSSKSEGAQTKNMLDEMVKKGEALACPSCQVIMMKKWGCDWVRCSMCKTEICWVTKGPRWGPSGKGDITAGCQCGVNGIKCHPKCNYCH